MARGIQWAGVHRGLACPGCDLCEPQPTACYWGQHDIDPGTTETLYYGDGGEVSHLRCVPASELRGADL